MFWYVKTGRQRVLPLFPQIKEVLERGIGGRRAGFVFLNEEFVNGTRKSPVELATPRAFHERLQKVVDNLRAKDPVIRPAALAKATRDVCREFGQIPERRVRQEFMKLTKRIGRPELTRAHDLRHLFSTRAQEMGINPLLVQELLGHKSLGMTWRYTHIGMDTKREAVQKVAPDFPRAANA